MSKTQQTNTRLELTDDDLAKIAKTRAKVEGAQRAEVDREWYFIAEFGMYYDWEAVQTVLYDKDFDPDTFSALLNAGRAVWATRVNDLAEAQFIASVAATSTQPATVFNKLMAPLRKKAEVAS
ncbi:hypothetical protein MPC38_06780 [Prescottella equi]|uniref:hypothetical protein n=1 Tax=Rhodococcus hoagii TaxID=43767 RepID=UPI001F5BFE62|nr:hypothetical protein [Prescottella equi]UNQ40950.1 hypothetical protein MPC38_06780 [Prescottella equi]